MSKGIGFEKIGGQGMGRHAEGDRAGLTAPVTLMNSVQVNELVVFREIIDTGSFKAAAKKLGISAPSASKLIRRLEERLNERLFERSTLQITLTDFGQQFQHYSNRIIDELESANHFLQHQKEEPEGLLSVGIPNWLLVVVGADFIESFKSRHPRIRFSFFDAVASRLDEDLGVDLYIHAFEPLVRKWATQDLVDVTAGFYASRKYLERSETIEHPLQLTQHEVLLIRHPAMPDGSIPWTDDGVTKWVPIKQGITLDSIGVAVNWAESGLGVVFCPNQLVNSMGYENTLVPLFGGKYDSTFAIKCFYKPKSIASPKIKVFIDELKTHLQQKLG